MELDLPPCSKLDPSWPLDPLISKATFLGMSYMFGQLFGSFVAGLVGDLLGRIPTMMLFIVATAGLHLGGSFVTSYWLYFFIRMFSGAFSKGLFIPASTYVVEITAPEYRMPLGILLNVKSLSWTIIVEIFTSVLFQIPYALGEMFVGLMAYLMQDWRTLQMTLAILVFLLAGLWIVMPESPRWLISKGKMEKARTILMKAARMNRKTIPIGDLLILEHDHVEEKLGVWSLFSG